MQMTKGVEYGIEGILYLARRCGDEPALIRENSRATAIPETFLTVQTKVASILEQTTLEDILQATS